MRRLILRLLGLSGVEERVQQLEDENAALRAKLKHSKDTTLSELLNEFLNGADS